MSLRAKIFTVCFAVAALFFMFLTVRDEKIMGQADGEDLDAMHGQGGATKVSKGNFKRADRAAPLPRPTHLPEELVRFFLPSMRIEGLNLNEALELLLETYRETCAISGEVPLHVKFVTPRDKPLPDLLLEARSFDRTIQLLAGLCGMEVRRSGTTYKLTEIEGDAHPNKKTAIAPDTVSRIAEMFGNDEGDLGKLLSEAGVSADSGMKIEVAAEGLVTIEGGTAAERAIAINLLGIVSRTENLQHKLTSRIVEIPPHLDLGFSNKSVFTEGETQVIIRELGNTEGVHTMTLPSVTSLSGKEASIEIMKEVFSLDATGKVREKPLGIGKKVTVKSSSVGFGNNIDFRYEDIGLDPVAPSGIRHLSDVRSEGYLGDKSSRIISTEREDGSRYLTIVTVTLIDATGKPLSESRDWKVGRLAGGVMETVWLS